MAIFSSSDVRAACRVGAARLVGHTPTVTARRKTVWALVIGVILSAAGLALAYLTPPGI